MKLPRFHRIVTMIVAICSLLFMQLAMAAYRCPGPARMEMRHCAQMDDSPQTLCQSMAQGDAAKQSLDKLPVADVPDFQPVLMAVLQPVLAESADDGEPAPVFLSHSTDPPISIRHCCFRI
jgi:hypothetical protein